MTERTETITRAFSVERLKADDGKITYRASLSSETPVKDLPFLPPIILRHESESIDFGDVSDRGLPLVANHGMAEKGMGGIHNVIGRIRNMRLEGKRTVGDLHFSDANPNAAIVRAMVDEGTLTDMSITAKIMRSRTVEKGKDEFVEALRWAPIEASIVGAGGDHAVGIGRSRQEAATAGGTEMTSQTDDKAVDKAAENREESKEQKVVERIEQGRQAIDENRAIKLEETRQQAIRNLAEANKIGDDTVQEWISRGYGLDQVADNILAIHKKRGETNQAKSHLGLTDKEVGQYSLCRAILAAHSGKWEDAGFELECHEAVAKEIKKVPDRGGFFVPLDVQRRALPADMGALAQRHQLGYLVSRDLNVATPGQGGYLTQTVNMGFDELLRNISFAYRMGAQRLSGLRDNVTIPRQSAAATAEWLTSETDSATESQQTFVQLSLSPKTVSAYTELSRQLLLQSTIDAEGLVNADLAAVAGLAVDAAVLNGSGASGQPEGLDTVTGVGTVTGTSLGFPGILEFQTDVAAANVMPMRGGYVTTPAVASLMIQRVKYTSTASPLWEGNIWAGSMQGFPAMSTNQVAAATMYFGDWAKAVIAEWGVLEVETNPYANFPAGIIGVRAMYSVDVGIRYPAAFSKAATIT